MKRKTLVMILFFAAVFSTFNCVKKQFVPLEQPHAVMHIRPGAKVEILQEPLKTEMILWDASVLAQIPVEGLLRVTYKKTDYFYLQMNCPAELKCNGKKVYIPRNLTHAPKADSLPFKAEYTEPPADASSARFVLAEAASLKDLVVARDWFAAPAKREIPTSFDEVIFNANLPEKNQLVAYGHYAYLERSVYSNEYAEKPPADFLAGFPVYEEIARTKGANLNEAQKKFLRNLGNEILRPYNALKYKEVDEFPFENPSYPAMAKAFNKISAPAFFKDEILERIVAETKFIVKQPATTEPVAVPGGSALYAQVPGAETATPVQIKISTSIAAGIIFEIQESPFTKLPTPESEIIAVAHPKGLAFQLGKDKQKATVLEPVEESMYLKSGNKEEIQKFIKQIPNHEKVIEDFDFDLALMRLAMKYGEGGMSRSSGLFEYHVDLSKGRNFWIVLSAVKNLMGVSADDVYSGEVPDHLSGLEGMVGKTGGFYWYQKYEKASKHASMGVKGKINYCQRTCFDEEIDSICFDNQSHLKVTFRPSAMHAVNVKKGDTPGISELVHADFAAAQKDNPCNAYFKLRLTADNFK